MSAMLRTDKTVTITNDSENLWRVWWACWKISNNEPHSVIIRVYDSNYLKPQQETEMFLPCSLMTEENILQDDTNDRFWVLNDNTEDTAE